MIPKPFGDTITKQDIDNLVANAVREGRTIEYKESGPGISDGDKKEFLADVSSFANASGGDILYGVPANRDADNRPTGLPDSPTGLTVNADEEKLRVESLLRDGIQPRIPAVRVEAVSGYPNGPVMVVRVAKSWAAPHMVVFKSSSRFFSRNSAGKYPMDVTEIRWAFGSSETLPEKIRAFRDGRLAKIIAGDTPVAMMARNLVVLHILPVMAFVAADKIDVTRVDASQLPPLYLPNRAAHGWDKRLNLDGLLTYTRSSEATCLYYTLLFRSGAIEAVDIVTLYAEAGAQKTVSLDYEPTITFILPKYLDLLRQLAVTPPVFLFLTMIGVKGYTMPVEARKFAPNDVIDRDILSLPEVVVDDFSRSPEVIMKPIFDAVWQSAGFRGSWNYDNQGKWAPRR